MCKKLHMPARPSRLSKGFDFISPLLGIACKMMLFRQAEAVRLGSKLLELKT
jgi:hypothetical protein